jgi:putative membrane protein
VKEAKKANDSTVDSLAKNQSVTDSSTTIPTKQDADFVVKAASGGMLEVELGKLAQTHASKQGVKDFGAMMVADHSKGGDELKTLAMRKRIVLPDSVSNDQKKERDDLMKKHGAEFDRSYISLMVKDHKDDIDEFEKAARNANDADIKAFAANTVGMLKMHLDSAQKLDKAMPKRISSGPKTAPPYQ